VHLRRTRSVYRMYNLAVDVTCCSRSIVRIILTTEINACESFYKINKVLLTSQHIFATKLSVLLAV